MLRKKMRDSRKNIEVDMKKKKKDMIDKLDSLDKISEHQ
jgi:hypothetical protein